jgi:bacterioferritin (cytochrome b1)
MARPISIPKFWRNAVILSNVEGTSLVDMIREDLVAERIAIESYSEIIRYLGGKDPTSRRVMEEVLAKEEEHADDLKNLIESVAEAEKRARFAEEKTPARKAS